MGKPRGPQVQGTKENHMANNQSDFSRKFKELCRSRAVIVTTVTLLVVVGIAVAATVSANRAKRPLGGQDTGSLTVTD